MNMGGDGGILSVPSDHTFGLIALVAAPLLAWVLVCACQALALRRVGWAERVAGRLAELPAAARGALFASYVGGLVHLVLVQPHWSEDRTRALLFILDAAGFGLAAFWTFAVRPYWRAASLVMLSSTVVGYAVYVLRGWEQVDLVGLVTTTVELASALYLLVPQPVNANVGAPAKARARERWVAAFALPLALVSVLGTSAIASATLPGGEANATHGTAHHAGADGLFATISGLTSPPARGMAGMRMPNRRPMSAAHRPPAPARSDISARASAR